MKNTGFVQLPKGYVSNQEIDLGGTGWKILLLGLTILAVGIVLGVVLSLLGMLPVINFERFKQDPKRGWLLICQLIFMIALIAIIFLLMLIFFKKAGLRRMTGFKAKVELVFFVSVKVPFYFTRSGYINSRLNVTLILSGILMVFTTVCAFLPEPLILIAYCALFFYLAGSADDFYLAYKASKSSADAVFYDYGGKFCIFLPGSTVQKTE